MTAVASALGLALLAGLAAAPTEPAAPPLPTPAPAPGGNLPATNPGPASAPAAEPREIVLVLFDGRVFTGQLVERTPERYVLSIAGINTTFAADQVERATLKASVTERYTQWRGTLADSDAEGLLALADWLERAGRPDLALTEMEALASRQPDNPAVRRRAQMLRSLIELERSKPGVGQPVPGAGPGTGAGAGDSAEEPGPDGVPLLTREQANLMKVFELDLARPPRVIVPREVVERAIAKYAQSPEVPTSREGRDALLRRPPLEQLDLLFRLRAREFYPEVEVLGLPEPLKRFRDGPHREYVINSCATSGCHGGETGGRLRLSRTRPNSEVTVLTNFYILSQFQVNGPDGKGPVPLLDWKSPDRSPLMQMGLPRSESIFPHPPVVRSASGLDVWRPALLSREDRRAKEIAGWLESMVKPRPEYTLKYDPIRPFVPGTPVVPPASNPR